MRPINEQDEPQVKGVLTVYDKLILLDGKETTVNQVFYSTIKESKVTYLSITLLTWLNLLYC